MKKRIKVVAAVAAMLLISAVVQKTPDDIMATDQNDINQAENGQPYRLSEKNKR